MTESNRSGGVGFPGLLAVLFIGLKLGHVIHWSWWWVLAPLWITAILVAIIAGGAAVAYVVKEIR